MMTTTTTTSTNEKQKLQQEYNLSWRVLRFTGIRCDSSEKYKFMPSFGECERCVFMWANKWAKDVECWWCWKLDTSKGANKLFPSTSIHMKASTQSIPFICLNVRWWVATALRHHAKIDEESRWRRQRYIVDDDRKNVKTCCWWTPIYHGRK